MTSLLTQRPYWQVPNRPADEIAQAFYRLFSGSEDALIALDAMYWGFLMTQGDGEKQQGLRLAFLFIIDMCGKGELLTQRDNAA